MEKKDVTVSDIEVYLRELVVKCFEYRDGKIPGIELGLSQARCAVMIRELFKEKEHK